MFVKDHNTELRLGHKSVNCGTAFFLTSPTFPVVPFRRVSFYQFFLFHSILTSSCHLHSFALKYYFRLCRFHLSILISFYSFLCPLFPHHNETITHLLYSPPNDFEYCLPYFHSLTLFLCTKEYGPFLSFLSKTSFYNKVFTDY